jgi:hypothetical protein
MVYLFSQYFSCCCEGDNSKCFVVVVVVVVDGSLQTNPSEKEENIGNEFF